VSAQSMRTERESLGHETLRDLEKEVNIAPKYSASALDRVTERCILENQWKRQPWRSQ
jgi:hypothetical protein